MTEKIFKLSHKERKKLQRLYKQERDRLVSQRVQAILLLDSGKSAKEVAQILLVSPKTIKRWIKIYATLGWQALVTLKHNEKGVQARLNLEQLAKLEQHLDAEVASSAKEVMAYIEKEFGVTYSESGVTKLLKKLAYSYKKPALVPAKADFAKQQAFVELYQEKIRCLSLGDEAYFVDAVHFLHNAVAGYGWIKRGVEMVLRTNSGRNRYNVLGAYSPLSKSFLSIEGVEKCDAEMVKRLLKKIRQENPQAKKIIVILDNVPYQHAKKVKRLAKRLRIELLYLPSYSPNLNLIERFWKFMKKKVVRNKYYESFSKFVVAVQDFLGNLDQHKAELSSLMTENFHLFKAIA